MVYRHYLRPQYVKNNSIPGVVLPSKMREKYASVGPGMVQPLPGVHMIHQVKWWSTVTGCTFLQRLLLLAEMVHQVGLCHYPHYRFLSTPGFPPLPGIQWNGAPLPGFWLPHCVNVDIQITSLFSYGWWFKTQPLHLIEKRCRVGGRARR